MKPSQSSRYASTGTAEYVLPDGRKVIFLRRRLVPQPEEMELLAEHKVASDERLDLIAAKYFRDPELFWRLCDANRALQPQELEEVGRVLRITQPPGLPGVETDD